MIRIYGASDDLIEIEGDVDEELSEGTEVRVLDVLKEKCSLGHEHSTVTAGIGIKFIHSSEHGWTFITRLLGKAFDDEKAKMPWPVRIEAKDYTPVVFIEAPKTAKVEWDEEEE